MLSMTFFGLPTAAIAAILLAIAAVIVVNALFAMAREDVQPVPVEARVRR